VQGYLRLTLTFLKKFVLVISFKILFNYDLFPSSMVLMPHFKSVPKQNSHFYSADLVKGPINENNMQI